MPEAGQPSTGAAQGVLPPQDEAQQSPQPDGKPASKVPRCRQCQEPGCGKTASFNFPGEVRRTHCAAHKKEGMVQASAQRCTAEGCKKQASFCNEGEKKALFCREHKQEGMIGIRSVRCKSEGCMKDATYNFPGTSKRVFCAGHAEPGMVDRSHGPASAVAGLKKLKKGRGLS
ncbi:hypothetical protein WJX72_001904 [[Myrmecia] bisecta]|uniref:EsV-1-7 n=1 Tax=[Myrmecia] bisecta TaxID=41462 RepID=A0AAW1PDC6_9CHLO